MKRKYDVTVIGAGPAGLSTALKCAEYDYDVTILEKRNINKFKPCGGVTPEITKDILYYDLNLQLPNFVLTDIKSLGLYYVPPSGIDDGGYVKNYKLINLDRAKFDRWLCEIASQQGITIKYGVSTLLIRCIERNLYKIRYEDMNGENYIETKYIIGADGVFSFIRRRVLLDKIEKFNKIIVIQGYSDLEMNFGNFFYMFFLDPKITPIYGYIIPKGRFSIIGLGVYPEQAFFIYKYYEKFLKWLYKYGFLPNKYRFFKREIGFIPYYNDFILGKENIILVGDACGYVNAISGEGIRYAIESGVSAGFSIYEAEDNKVNLLYTYNCNIRDLIQFILKTKKLMPKDVDSRRDFVKRELLRKIKM